MASFAPMPFRRTDPQGGGSGGFMPPTGGWGAPQPMEKMPPPNDPTTINAGSMGSQPQIDPNMGGRGGFIPPNMGGSSMPMNGGVMKPMPAPMAPPPPMSTGGFGAPPMRPMPGPTASGGMPQPGMSQPQPGRTMGRRPNPRRRF